MAFGFGLPKLPTQALAGDPNGAPGLSFADKLMMFGAVAKGHPEMAMQIPLMAAARRQFQMQQAATTDLANFTSGKPVPSRADLTAKIDPANAEPPPEAPGAPPMLADAGALGKFNIPAPATGSGIGLNAPTFVPPRSPMADAAGGPVTVRGALPFLSQLAKTGGNIEPWTKLLDAAQPKSVVVNGRVLDEHDPSVYGQYYGEAPAKGAEPVYDGHGRQVGWHMADGAIQAIQSSAQATAAGTKAGELPFAGPTAEAQAAGTERGKLPFTQASAAAEASGKAIGEAPYTLVTKDVNGVPTTMTQAQALALAGGGTASDAQPRGVRNNNPLNLTVLPHGQWEGQTGADGQYATFATPEAGRAAADKNLQAYGANHGINTLAGVIQRWAPPGQNDTAAYIGTVSKDLGLDPRQPIDLSKPQVRAALLDSMQKVELGRGAATAPSSVIPAAAPAAGPASVGFHGLNADDEKRAATYADDAKTAEDVAQKAHQFQDLNKKTFTGPIFNPVRVHIPFLGDIPLNPISGIGSAFQPGSQAMDNLSMQMATGLRASGQRLTQAEIFQNLKTVPRRGSLPASNDTSAAVMDTRAQTKRAYANFASDWLTAHGSLNGMDAAWAARQGQGSGGAPAAGPPMKAQPMQQIKLKSGGVATVVPVG